MKKKADLHIHSIYSDGTLPPEEIFRMAVDKGLSAISITDHDSVEGCIKANELSEKYKLEFINGIEFSCYEKDQEYHILGYNFDINNEELHKYLDAFRKAREQRAHKITGKLKKLDVDISFDKIVMKAASAPITRPHIASVLIDEGYVSNIKEAFTTYLAEGKPAYEPKYYFSVYEAIKLVNNCGGVAVLAHPANTISQAFLFNIIENGLDGIEVIHPMHDENMQRFYTKIANQFWLLTTGGSDFHGSRDYDETNFGKFVVPYSVVNSIKTRAHDRLF